MYANTECSSCQTYTKPASTTAEYKFFKINDACLPDQCNLRQKVTEDGTCKDCDKFERQDPDDNKVCTNNQQLIESGQEVCTSHQKLLPDGTCEECPNFTRKIGTLSNGKCIPSCENPQYMMMKNGECKDCIYKKMSKDGLSCEPTTCLRSERKRLLPSGKCDDQPCADYLVLSEDTKSC